MDDRNKFLHSQLQPENSTSQRCVCVCTRKSTSFCQCRLLTTSSTKLIIIFRENVDSLVAGALTTLHNSAHTFLHRYFHRFCLFISYYYVYRMLFTLLFMFVWDGATLQPFQRGSMYIFFPVCVFFFSLHPHTM